MCHDGAMLFDLHTHSTFSDGTTTPSEIAAESKSIGLTGFALTDHDTTEGWQEAREAATREGIDFFPGIELTTTHGYRSVHLLAYGFDVNDDELQTRLQRLRNSRRERAHEMVRRLRIDFEYDWDTLMVQSTSGDTLSIGRPHLADALVAGGYFRDRSHAFAEALSSHGPYYVPTDTLSTLESIDLVKEAGGVSVLAHPAAFRMRRPLERSVIRELTEAGLDGIEIFHPENRAEWIEPIREESERLGLILTGASDYHGAGKPNRLGEFTSDEAVVEELRSRVHTPR